jgi:hypothetical protein
MRSVTTKHNYQTALQHLILFSIKHPQTNPHPALHFAHYNLVRLHRSLRVTPAMAAGVTDRLWSLEELVDRTSK